MGLPVSSNTEPISRPAGRGVAKTSAQSCGARSRIGASARSAGPTSKRTVHFPGGTPLTRECALAVGLRLDAAVGRDDPERRAGDGQQLEVRSVAVVAGERPGHHAAGRRQVRQRVVLLQPVAAVRTCWSSTRRRPRPHGSGNGRRHPRRANSSPRCPAAWSRSPRPPPSPSPCRPGRRASATASARWRPRSRR